MITNIMLAGVGGQGLILMTRIMCQTALKAGYDVKSNDVVGLSQRGGMVWGNVRLGEEIYSPNIPLGEGNYLVAMEPLEALRWSANLRQDATIIMNCKPFYPTLVQQEKYQYPEAEISALKDSFNVVEINAFEEAKNLGKKQASNVILLGILASYLSIDENIWRSTIKDNVPYKAIEVNLKAFELGYSVVK